MSPPPPAPPLKPLYAWTQVIGETELCVKAIMESPVLPDLRVDGLSFTMYQRPPPKGQKNAFPVYVFEAHIPITADSVVLEGQPLPVLKPKTEKLAVLGDTGCRITKTTAQACKDPKAWPFATVAKSIAQYQPDLIIHTGDYYYREAPCPLPELCGGSPYGDNWDTWRADWFEPGSPSLQDSPPYFNTWQS